MSPWNLATQSIEITASKQSLKGHGGNSTRERALTDAEELPLRHSWELYKTFLAEDYETIEMIDNIYGPGKASALNTPEKRACWRVGHETQKSGGFRPAP